MSILKRYKKFLKSCSVWAVLVLVGCGGGTTKVVTQPLPDNNGTVHKDKKSSFKYDRICIAGSSITHGAIKTSANEGEGYLGELSYVGAVEKYFRENVANTIGPAQLTDADSSYDEPMSYQGKIRVFKSGAEIQASLKPSDEITIVYAGSNIKTVVELDVDDKVFTYTIPSGLYTPAKKTFDDTNVDFYKAFRETNEQAVKTWKLDSDKAHTFTLKVKEGELHLNFITNHMYYMQNAGVGGYETSDFLNTTREHSNLKDIITFNPDLFIYESCTNDAKTWAVEIGLKNGTSGENPSTNKWIVDDPINFTITGKNITINQAVNVKKGDVVIMGKYDGDIQNMAVGIVAKDTNGRMIPLSKIVSYSGKNAHEVNSVPQDINKICRIKNISLWEDRVKELIANLKNGIGHDVAVGIGTSGVPNYYNPANGGVYTLAPNTPRRLLGYREKGQILAAENGWFFVDFFQKILGIEPGVDINHKWTFGDNTHPNVPGRVYFGQAIIDALNLKP